MVESFLCQIQLLLIANAGYGLLCLVLLATLFDLLRGVSLMSSCCQATLGNIRCSWTWTQSFWRIVGKTALRCLAKSGRCPPLHTRWTVQPVIPTLLLQSLLHCADAPENWANKLGWTLIIWLKGITNTGVTSSIQPAMITHSTWYCCKSLDNLLV